jgi:hypothetical protein
LITAFLTGCGYQVLSSNQPVLAFTVAPIQGDNDGVFLQTIIRVAETYPGVEYQAFDAPCVLKAKFVHHSNDHIGYKYQTEDGSGEIINRLSPTEGQHTLEVELMLVDAITQKKIVGPKQIEVTVDYDFVDSKSYNDLTFINPLGLTRTVLDYSLGQLDSEEAATIGSKERLYQKTAHEILSFLIATL